LTQQANRWTLLLLLLRAVESFKIFENDFLSESVRSFYNAASPIEFLKQLSRFAGKQRIIPIWDRLPAPRSLLIKK
jgi:hypothetical protein